MSTFHYTLLTYWWGVYDLNLLGKIPWCPGRGRNM
jgi:hypothetical protein